MTEQQATNADQAALWNGPGGRAWVDAQAALDQLFKPFETLIADAVRRASVRRVLDVGCGTGSTTLAVTRALGAGGSAFGIDISAPMLAVARERAEREGLPITFACADAQTHVFEPASIDMIVSRFGVMFFDDPVRAFANLRHAMRDNGALFCIAWRSPAENPFMTTAERTAAPLLPLPPRLPDAPGQFAFADQQRVQSILEAAGWTDVDIQPVNVTCTMPQASLATYFTRLGPVGIALQGADEATRAKVLDALRVAFQPFVHGDDAQFTAACWTISARAQQASA
ncbi:MAG: class I SAM-dependent methyltransferase [Cupriavidus sp.]|nr:class I SAM-dependent methyltransferase [Cupriavidus sp.]